MVQYISKPVYKFMPRFGKITVENLLAYAPNFMFWGAAGMWGLFTFTEGVPIFQTTFFQKIPYFGDHWVKVIDPQDSPQ